MSEPWVIVVLLGMVIFTFAWIQHKKSGDKPLAPSGELLKEMEETFEHFAGDIEEDNRKVIEYVAALKENYEHKMLQLQERISALEKAFAALPRDGARETAAASALSSIAAVPPNASTEALTATPAPSAPSPSGPAPAVQAREQAGPSAVQDETSRIGRSGTIAARYKPIFDLHAGGKSIEYIAKKVGMNKGEVQLILTLSGQEEASRAEE